MLTRFEISRINRCSVRDVDNCFREIRKHGLIIKSFPTPNGGIDIPEGRPAPTNVWHFEPNTPVSCRGKKPTSPISREARIVLNVLKKSKRLMTAREIGALTGINAKEAVAELRAKGIKVYSFPTRAGGYGLPCKDFVQKTSLYRYAV